MTDSSWGAGSRDALLIASGTYDDRTLSALRSPVQDCAVLAEVLADPGIGAFRTEQVRDAPAHQVTRAIERFFLNRGRSDLLLVHISCHGIKDDDGHLYFAARDTDHDLLASTAVPAAFLRDRMERCRARTIVVLLDCCYSGAFLPGAKGDDRVHVRDELSGHGRAVLTATNRTEYAWEGPRVTSAAPQPSLFTGALIEGLRTGAADLNGDGRITVTELHEYVYEAVQRAGAKQHPRMWADLEYQVTVARVREAPFPTGRDTPPATGESPSARRGRDCVSRLELTLEETAKGTLAEVCLEGTAVCPACSGSAASCATCDGQGRVAARREVTLRIPAGVRDGERIRLRGKGEAGTGGGAAGDAYVDIVEKPHRTFERRGDDLHRGVTVPRATAATGGTVRIGTLDGMRTIRIPRGIRQGQRLRFPGLGVPRRDGSGRGDLLVRVDIGD